MNKVTGDLSPANPGGLEHGWSTRQGDEARRRATRWEWIIEWHFVALLW